MSEKNTIRFYFDFISHNAYLAWVEVNQIAQRTERRLEPVPVLFAGFLEAGGQLGPAEIPAKSRWMIRDVVRKAVELGIPIAPPASHPFNPLASLRVASFDDAELGQGKRHELINALFRAAWAESRDLADPEVVAAVATEVGLDGPGLLERADRPAVKQRLRQATDDAIAIGVFGVPSMVVSDQLFWGFDDLPHLEALLRGEDPLRSYDFSPWQKVQPSVHRRRP